MVDLRPSAAELAAHPTDGDPHHELYLMCEDALATVEELRGKGVEFTKEITDEGFGLMTTLRLPGVASSLSTSHGTRARSRWVAEAMGVSRAPHETLALRPNPSV